MAKKPLQTLYESLRASNYDVPDNYGSFERTLTAPGTEGVRNRQTLYKSLRDSGYDVPDTYESFSRTLFSPVKPTGGTAATGQSMFPADVEERRMRTRNKRETHPLNKSRARQRLQTQQQAIEAQQQRWEQDNKRFKEDIARREQRLPGGMDRFEERAKEHLATGEAAPVPLAPNDEVVRGDIAFNPDTGRMEQTYTTPEGGTFFDRDAAQFDHSLQNMPEDEIEMLERERELIGMGILRRGRELDEEYENQSWWDRFLAGLGTDPEMGPGPRERMAEDDEELQSLLTAWRKNRNALRILYDERNNDMNSFWHNFGTTVANGYTFTGGRAELHDAQAILNSSKRMDEIQRKMKAGEKLSNVENAALSLANNTAWDNAIQAMYGDDYGAWATAGGAAVQSLEMMPEFIAGMPILKGMGTAAINLLTRNAAKGFGRFMLKGLGMTLGTMAGGAIMANTIQAERTLGKAAGKAAGSWWFGDDGEFMLGHYDGDQFVSGGESLATALFHAEQEAIPEAASEGAGEFLPGIGQVLSKIGLSRIAKPLATLSGKGWYKTYQNMLRAAGWHGVGGEALEEYVGTLDGLIMGDLEGVKRLADPRTHFDIWLSCATLGPLLNAPVVLGSSMRGVYSPVAYHKLKAAVTRQDKIASFRLTEDRWAPWRERIDATPNEQMADLMVEIRDDQELAPQEKKAIFDYVKALQGYRGWNLGEYIFGKDAEEDGEGKSEQEQQQSQEYSNGYETVTPEERRAAKDRLDVARARLEQKGYSEQWMQWLDNAPAEDVMNDLTERGLAGDTEAVMEYLNAKSAYDGMLQRVNDDIDDEVAVANEAIDQRIAPEDQGGDGMIHPAVLKGGREVFIISGNVATLADNSIDVENSDGMIIVRDAEGNEDTISPDNIQSLGEVIDPAQQRQDAEQMIIDEQGQAAAAQIEGQLPFNVGDQYTISYQGEPHTYQVVQAEGDNVAVLVDGAQEPVVLTRQQLQQMADEERAEQIQAQAASADAVEEEPAAVEPEQPVEAPAVEETPVAPVAPEDNPTAAMPMDDQGEPAWDQVEPERGHQFLYQESGWPQAMADNFVQKRIDDAEKALTKAQEAGQKLIDNPKPTFSAQQQAVAENTAAQQAAQAALDYWKGVQGIQAQATAPVVEETAPVVETPAEQEPTEQAPVAETEAPAEPEAAEPVEETPAVETPAPVAENEMQPVEDEQPAEAAPAEPAEETVQSAATEDQTEAPAEEAPQSDAIPGQDAAAEQAAREEKAANIEAGGAIVDQLQRMGVDVNTDLGEYRKTLSEAKKDKSDAGKVRYLKNSNGTTYGFVYRGKINIDPRKINAELPLHEYGHLWAEAIRAISPDRWQQIVDVLKSDADTWSFLQERRPDLQTDDEIAEEMIAEFSGKNGEAKLKAELERLSKTNSDYKTKWGNIYKNIVKAIQDFWKQVGDFLQIDYTTPQQIYDQVLKDFASGMNPRERVERFLQERDVEFVDAVNRGDMATATRLFNEALTAEVGNGMTPFISVGSHKSSLGNLARKVKRGDKAAIEEVAKLMAPIIPENAVLIPAPSHTGRATYMLDIANAIAKITGSDVADILVGPERGTQYEQKKATGKAMTSAELGVTVEGELPEGKIPVVLDNVVATGNTAEACVQALGKGIVCSLTKATDQYNHASTLKSANVVVRDANGNVIPLSKRFDLSQSKRLGNIEYQDMPSTLPGNRVELNYESGKDAESRAYIEEVMEREGWDEEAKSEFRKILDDAADLVSRMAQGFTRLREWNNKKLTDEQGNYNPLWRVFDKDDGWIPTRSSFKKNGEYPYNIDLGALCTKREAFDAVVRYIKEQGWGQNLGPTQIEALKSLLREHGFLTACDICFNETRRARALDYGNAVAYYWNAVRQAVGIDDDLPIGTPRELTEEQMKRLTELSKSGKAFSKYVPKELRRTYETYVNTKGQTKRREVDKGLTPTMTRKVAKLFLQDPSLMGKFEGTMVLSTDSVDALVRQFPHTDIARFLAGAWGSNTPKPNEGFNIYDPLSWKQTYDKKRQRPAMEWFFNLGGMRAQSFSDYSPIFFYDYVQMFTDLAIRRLPIHIYTKVPALIKLFGGTGAKFNMSLVPEVVQGVDPEHLGLKPDGNGGWVYAWHEDSFPVDEAFALRQDPRFNGNVGTIAVGISDAHIRMLLDDPTIDMVIPYHKSGMPPSIQVKTGLDKATDYTDDQHSKKRGKALKNDFSFNEALRRLGDPRKAADEYLAWCKENNYTPKYPQFADHPNYYKVLEDFRCIDNEGNYSPQQPVQVSFFDDVEQRLSESLEDRTMQEGLDTAIRGNDAITEGIKKIMSKPRLDGKIRDMMLARLKQVLGKDNVASLKQEDFFEELQKVYTDQMGAERAQQQVEVLRTSGGIVYGFAVGDRIVLNENYFNAETPMHEFTHVWVKVARLANPQMWAEGKELLKQTKEWQEVMSDEFYRDIQGDEDAVASEVLARIVGQDAARQINEMFAPEDKPQERPGIYNKIKQWVNKFLDGVRSLFSDNAKGLTYDELVRMPMKALFDDAESARFMEALQQVNEEDNAEFSIAGGLSQRERDYTANVLKKLRGAGVNVQLATEKETQRVLDAADKVVTQLMRGWHGSHANFDAFDHSHMGEGEGAQAYGWGTYITEVEGIARKYASAKPDAATIIKVSNGQRTVRVMEDLVNGMKKDLDENTRNLQNTKKWIDEAKKELADIIKQYGQDSFEFSDWHRQRDMQMEAWQDDANSYKRAIKSIKSRLPKYEEKLEEARELLKKIEDELNRPGGRFLYEITIPENDGTNYLPYNGQLSEETTDKLINAIKENLDKTKRDKATYEAEISALRDPAQQKFGDDWLKSLSNEDHARFNDLIEKQYVAIQREAHLKSALIKAEMGDEFRYIQDQLEMAFGAKETSEFLSDLGFVGIEYPAMFRSGGRQDDAKNYVIFNEDDAQIINKTEFLKTSDGTVYGWHDNDGIHLTAAGLNPNTPMHEYTHGLMAMLKEREPEKYQQIVEALKDSEVWQEVLNDELYSSIRDDVDAVASEVASRLSGRESERRANESMPARIKRAIQELWDAVAEWFGVKSPITADSIARMTLRELERGTNPDAVMAEGQPLFQIKSLGAPYQGSKGQIATRVVDALPSGKRFVDLFSGGGAVTHAAMLSGKYEGYRMNDINPAGQELFLAGMRGDYRDYQPRELTAEEFKAIKGTPEGLLLSYSGYGRNVDSDKESVARRLRRVQRLEELKPYADQVEPSNTDYREVQLQPGDVVYADIPYEGTNKTGYREGAKFDKQAFSDWALGQDVPIYVSEQSMPEGWVEVQSWDMKAMRGKTRGEKLFVQAKFAGDGGRGSGRVNNATYNDGTQGDQTRSENFKRWFGDWENDPENSSKVVDDQGRPLVVYHQTNAKRWINRETGEDWEKLDWRKKMEWENKSQEEWEDAWEEQDFYTFDDRYARQSIEMPAIFFSPENDPHHEYGNRTIAVYLNMRNPAINPDIPNRGVTDTAGRDAMEALKAQGYDGFIRTDEDGNIREYGVFDSNQVKSADEVTFDDEGNEIPEEERYNPDEQDIRYRELDEDEDAELIDRLEKGPHITTYSTKIKVDDGYVPPMSSKDNETGEMRAPEHEQKWNESEERPDLAKQDKKTGKWKFDLKKSNDKDVNGVLYNPYNHSGSGMLNDQFSEAQDRDDLVVVEQVVPQSEETDKYKAEKANDPTGWKAWKAGPITAKMTGKRKVFLSRWHKITRVVPWSEVADAVAKDLGNQFDVLPTNPFPPQLRAELEKKGYKFVKTDNKCVIQEGEYKGATWSERYYDVYPDRAKSKDKREKGARAKAVKEQNASETSRMRSILEDGGTLRVYQKENGGLQNVDEVVVREDDGQWVFNRTIPGRFASRDAALDALADYAFREGMNVKGEPGSNTYVIRRMLPKGQKWRVEGVPGEFDTQFGAVDNARNFLQGHVFEVAEDGNSIEVLGAGSNLDNMLGTDTAAEQRPTQQATAKQRKSEERARKWRERTVANGRRRVEELGQRLGVKVTIVDDMSEQERSGLSKKKRRAKGWYDVRTGEVFINLGNHKTVSDIEATFLHEVVAHKGLRRLFGDEFDKFLHNVYYNVDASIREEINRLMAKNNWDYREATEEYLAKLAQQMNFERPEKYVKAWETVARLFRTLLQKMGLGNGMNLKDSDLRGILFESYHNMEKEGVAGLAESVEFRDWMEREANRRVDNATNETTQPAVAAEVSEPDSDQTKEDREYMDAVESGDIAKASRMVMEAAKRAMPNTKVVDESGRPLVVYHTNREGTGFYVFDTSVKRNRINMGSHFGTAVQAANIALDGESDGYKPKTYAVYLDLKNPLYVVDFFADDNAYWANLLVKLVNENNIDDPEINDVIAGAKEKWPWLDGNEESLWTNDNYDQRNDSKYQYDDLPEIYQALRNVLERLGYDGFVYENQIEGDGLSYVAFHPEQIKSAEVVTLDDGGNVIPLSERFNPEKEDIRFRDDEDELEDFEDSEDFYEEELEEEADNAEDLGEEVDDSEAGASTFQEMMLGKMLQAANSAGAAQSARVSAMRSLGGALQQIRKAMSTQRNYDRETVNTIVRLAREVMASGYFNDLTRGEVKRLLAAAKNVNGSANVTEQANKVVDTLLRHHLRECENLLKKQLKVKGSKTNASGVEVQAGLDIEGQRMTTAMKQGMRLDEQGLSDRVADCLSRMGSSDPVVAAEASQEWTGLLLAQMYHENIKASRQEEEQMREEMRQAKAEFASRRDSLSPEELKRQRQDLKDYIAATEDAIRQNRMERADAYNQLSEMLGGGIASSMERAKQWREQQKERVGEIQHNANSDLEGVPADEHMRPTWKHRMANWAVVRFFMKPLATFDYMLRMMGQKSPNGEGYLWNRFMGGWVEANDKEWRNIKAAHQVLDEKVKEVFNADRPGLPKFKVKRWSDLFFIERKMEGMDVDFWDGDQIKRHTLTPGNLLYIYMVNKMSDGKMKLRKMGMSDADVEAIKNHLDPRLIELADWLQDEFLVQKRIEYNAVHERLFGAPMAAIENYFPLKINSRSRSQEEDVNNQDANPDDNRGSTITGAIIKRVRNNKALDVTGADAFDVILEHIQNMEHWAAFAEFNRDLNTLLSYKRFRNRILNMSSARFGSGKKLWTNFKRVCAIASGVYRPKVDYDSVDTNLVNVAKGVTRAKISFRFYTALKQLLSYPAYLSEASPIELAKTTNPIGAVKAWKWAIDNLPGFAERWQSRQAGDTRLKDSDADWGLWKSKIIDTASRWGMSPNAFIDALTVVMGAKAIYETKRKQLMKLGYTEDQANKRALRDASVSYNETQQSSANAFTSAMQLDRTAASVALTVFRNSPMGYERRLLQSFANLKHMATKGYKEQSLEYLAKQMERDGLDRATAEAAAKKVYNRTIFKNIADIAIFGWTIQALWNLGSYLTYLFMGDDDDDKKEMLTDAMLHAIAGGIEGLTGGSVMSDTYNSIRSGEANMYSNELLPLLSDIESLKRTFKKDVIEGANDLVNLIIQAGVGVNPQTITDWVTAGLDAVHGDPRLANEYGLLVMRIMSAPQGQLDKLYIDELGLTAGEAKQLNAEEFANRYARYKMGRESTFTGWAYSEEGRNDAFDRYVKNFDKKLKERIDAQDIETLADAYDRGDGHMKGLIEKAIKKKIAELDDTALQGMTSNNGNGKITKIVRSEINKRAKAKAAGMTPEEFSEFNKRVKASVANASEEELRDMYNNADTLARKIIRTALDESIDPEVGDPYKSPNKEYGRIYNRIKTADDMEEDILLAKAQKVAKAAGDDDLAKEIASARSELTEYRKELTGGAGDAQVMKELREARKELINEYVKSK